MKINKNIIYTFFRSILTFIGGAFVVIGEIDDAPGLILIGFIFFFGTTYLNIKNRK